MPKDVDHGLRRAEVAEAARRVVLRRGLERTTVRDVAAEAGWSTGVLAHYFEGKNDLLKYALSDEALADHWRTARPKDLASIRAALREMLPANERMRDMWRVWMNFWATQPGDPEWEAEREKLQSTFRAQCAALVKIGQASRELRPELDPVDEGDRIAALVHGISVAAVLNPEAWPTAKQAAFLDGFLDSLRVPA
jgi:AcrR family transcriptional regulator